MHQRVGRRLMLGLALVGALGHTERSQGARRSGERLLAIQSIESLGLAAPTMSGTASVRITYPTARGRYPVVILSQGARSSPAMYARLAEHWAARGHVVLQPVPPELSPIAADSRNAATRRLPATVEARAAGTGPAMLFALGAPATAVPRHELFVRRMDVCLGGLLCRAPPGTTPDPAALSAVAEATTAFLQACLGGNMAAAAWLRAETPPDLANGRATLKVYP